LRTAAQRLQSKRHAIGRKAEMEIISMWLVNCGLFQPRHPLAQLALHHDCSNATSSVFAELYRCHGRCQSRVKT
jgi:hypothetical protein